MQMRSILNILTFGWVKKRRRLDALVMTGFGGIVDDSLDFIEGKPYAANNKLREAWVADEDNQLPDSHTHRPCQLLVAWSYNPIQLFGPDVRRLSRANVEALYNRTVNEEIAYENERKRKNTLILWGGIVAVVLAVCLFGVMLPVITKGVSSGMQSIQQASPNVMPHIQGGQSK